MKPHVVSKTSGFGQTVNIPREHNECYNGSGNKNTPYKPPMEEKMLKCLCFWCDEKFTFAHQCIK